VLLMLRLLLSVQCFVIVDCLICSGCMLCACSCCLLFQRCVFGFGLLKFLWCGFCNVCVGLFVESSF
jgi:hypothetical protein